jgi:hypothetical protein
VVVLFEPSLTANVTGIANNKLKEVPICTVVGLLQTQHGPIIGVFHLYAHNGTGKTIHSISQLHQFGTIFDDTPRQFGGKQRLETLDGYIITLSIQCGLPYMDTYPYVFFSADTGWHPQTVCDEYKISDLDLTDDYHQHPEYHPDSINAYGELIPYACQHDVYFRCIQPNQPTIDKISPNRGFSPRLRIQHTLVQPFFRVFHHANTLKATFQLLTSVVLTRLLLLTPLFLTLPPLMMAPWNMVEQKCFNFSVAIPAL